MDNNNINNAKIRTQPKLINVVNPGESNNPEVDKIDWYDTYQEYFSYNDFDGQKITVKRWYGGLDIGNGADYNAYHFKSTKRTNEVRLNYNQYNGESKNTYKINGTSDILFIYHFLDQRINSSIHKTKDDDIFCIQTANQDKNKKFQYLGFCEYLHECDEYNKKNGLLFITKAEFNKNKDEIFSKIAKLHKNEFTEEEINNEINNDNFKDLKELNKKLTSEYKNREYKKKSNSEVEITEYQNTQRILEAAADQNTKDLKFQLHLFEKIIGRIVEFVLTLLHIREKQNQKKYNTVDDLKSDKVNCKTIADKMRFNDAVDHFVSAMSLNQSN
jgi:hypothetical protein